jgi:hypothetical protein
MSAAQVDSTSEPERQHPPPSSFGFTGSSLRTQVVPLLAEPTNRRHSTRSDGKRSEQGVDIAPLHAKLEVVVGSHVCLGCDRSSQPTIMFLRLLTPAHGSSHHHTTQPAVMPAVLDTKQAAG